MKPVEIAYNKGYYVKPNGDVVGARGGILKLMSDKEGYLYFNIRYKGKHMHVAVHRLVAFQKFGAALFEDGIETRHVNNIKSDNEHDNITIGTHSENMMDIPESLRIDAAIKAASHVKKYDKQAVQKFHKENGNSYKKTMKEFDISSKGTH